MEQREYDDHKILFVMNETGDEAEQAIRYLRALQIPEGYVAEVIACEPGTSVAANYNAIQRASDARYKVYLDEGVTILQPDFLAQALQVLTAHPDIGLLGVLGTDQLLTNGVLYLAPHRWGQILMGNGRRITGERIPGACRDTKVVGGGVLVTQYDIPWRQDLFQGTMFLSASASVEYQRQGLRTAVLRTEADGVLLRREEMEIDKRDQKRFLDAYSPELYPLVSIVLPTYQRPEYFRLALESAVHQTYRNLDIFITDNSHNTETKEVYERYFSEDPRITYEHHPDFGEADNWNRAIDYENPEAPYVNWLMDDDIYMPEKIAKMMDFFITYPDVMLVTSYRQRIDADGNVMPDTPMNKPPIDHTARIKGTDMGRQILMMMNNYVGEPTTALAKKSGMLEGHRLGWTGREGRYLISDFPTWLRLLSQGDVIYIREPLSQFRQHPGQEQHNIFTYIAGNICWGLMMREAIEQNVFLVTEDERRTALVRYLYCLGSALRKLLPYPVWQDERLLDLLTVYQGTIEALKNGFRFSYEIHTEG